MNKVCMINVFFGELPHWFHYLLLSAKNNPDIDFIVFSDQVRTVRFDNVVLMHTDKEDFEGGVGEMFGKPDFKLDPVRKICDFKTAYGQIFYRITLPYEFWGHYDLDVIFGNISNFISDDDYERYDIISADPNRMCGPFTMYRTNKYIGAYALHHDWEDILFNQPPVAYDEIGISEAVKEHVDPSKVLYGRGSNGLLMQNYGSPHLSPPLRAPATWDNGTLTIDEDSRETMMIHMGFKNEMVPVFVNQEEPDISQVSRFHITTGGIALE